MLSIAAFNALLKTLEEPPEHVKFILATTEPQKLPATILSRCQRFDFKRISNEDIIKRLKIVCKESNIEITEGALQIIAVLSEGAMRDALSILERCIQDGENKIDEDKIKDLVGIPKFDFVNNIVKAIIEYNVENVIQSTNDILNQGKDLDNFLFEMIKYVKDILIFQSTKKLDLYNQNELEQINKISTEVPKMRLVQLIYQLSELQSRIKWSNQKSVVFQAEMIKLCAKPEEFTQVQQVVYTTQAPAGVSQTVQMSSSQANSVVVNNVQANNLKTNNVQKNVSTRPEIKIKASSEGIAKAWPNILGSLKNNGRIVLYTNLINTQAKEINDMTVGIEFSKGLTPFGKTVLEKQENVKELTKLVSMACGKEMHIKYIDTSNAVATKLTAEQNLQNFANDANIPLNIID